MFFRQLHIRLHDRSRHSFKSQNLAARFRIAPLSATRAAAAPGEIDPEAEPPESRREFLATAV